MANASTTGFGLKAAMRLGNTPAISGQSKYAIKDNTGVGLFKGNPLNRPTPVLSLIHISEPTRR